MKRALPLALALALAVAVTLAVALAPAPIRQEDVEPMIAGHARGSSRPSWGS